MKPQAQILTRQRFFIFSVLISLSAVYNAQAQPSNRLSGFYGGAEIGTISYNTHIIFDGVDDPAGRGDFGYGFIVGYNHIAKNAMVGVELLYHLAAVPDPYTFDPALVGFSKMDLRQAPNAGLDFRAGYLATKNLLLYGAAAAHFGTFRLGLGVEYAILTKLSVRCAFRSLSGHKLSASDFGTIPQEASLRRFDVDPAQLQFFSGLLFRF